MVFPCQDHSTNAQYPLINAIYGVKNTSKFNCIAYRASKDRLTKSNLEEVVAAFE